MYFSILAVLLGVQLSTLTDATPLPKTHKVRILSSDHICTNITTKLNHENYTQAYTCSMKYDYAIFGLYYDSCVPFDVIAPTSQPAGILINKINTTSPPPSLPNNILCCDSTYTRPATFDTLCVWGNGTNMAEWEAAGHPAGTLPTASEEEIRSAKCFVGPIVSHLSAPVIWFKD